MTLEELNERLPEELRSRTLEGINERIINHPALGVTYCISQGQLDRTIAGDEWSEYASNLVLADIQQEVVAARMRLFLGDIFSKMVEFGAELIELEADRWRRLLDYNGDWTSSLNYDNDWFAVRLSKELEKKGLL